MSAALDGALLVLSPTNLLALVAIALFAGQQGARAGVAFAAVFAIGVAMGAFVIASAYRDFPAALTQLGIAALAGILVAAAYRPPLLVTGILVFAGGEALALNTPPQAITVSGAIASQVGTGVAAVIAFLAIALTASAANRPWHGIALRVVGSWIAASAILVLALRLAR
jgi:urease accessory protein